MSIPKRLMPMLVPLLVAAGCGGSDEPGERAVTDPKVHDPGPIHVQGLRINPADEALFIATHTGLFRAPVGESTATRVAGRYQDTVGFTVVGPDRVLGSGHPDPRDGLPPFLGLIRSSDAGESWDQVSLLGKRDFHVLEALGKRVYGHGSDYESREEGCSSAMTRARAGSHVRRADPLISAAIDPADADRLAASGSRRLYLSDDGARSWRALDALAGLLAWTENGFLYLVVRTGAGPGLRSCLDDGQKREVLASGRGAPDLRAVAPAPGRPERRDIWERQAALREPSRSRARAEARQVLGVDAPLFGGVAPGRQAGPLLVALKRVEVLGVLVENA
jgi:hypothetical protein